MASVIEIGKTWSSAPKPIFVILVDPDTVHEAFGELSISVGCPYASRETMREQRAAVESLG